MTTRTDAPYYLTTELSSPSRDDGAPTAESVRPPSDLVRSVSRALGVLEVVGTAGAALSAKSIARRTGLNLSTTYHLLHTLCWEGYLVRLPSGDFGLGASVAHRYRDLVTSLGAPEPMREVLRRLTARTGHTGFLGRLVEGRAALTDVVHAPGAPWVDDLTPGFEGAATSTPIGQVLQCSATAPGPGAAPGLVVEDGRLRADLSCAVVSVRRPDAADGPVGRWAIGLSGPLGCFSGAAPALHALLQAGAELAAAALPREAARFAPAPRR
jgi:hypothetical protein